jgi:hypothetical protein
MDGIARPFILAGFFVSMSPQAVAQSPVAPF